MCDVNRLPIVIKLHDLTIRWGEISQTCRGVSRANYQELKLLSASQCNRWLRYRGVSRANCQELKLLSASQCNRWLWSKLLKLLSASQCNRWLRSRLEPQHRPMTVQTHTKALSLYQSSMETSNRLEIRQKERRTVLCVHLKRHARADSRHI